MPVVKRMHPMFRTVANTLFDMNKADPEDRKHMLRKAVRTASNLYNDVLRTRLVFNEYADKQPRPFVHVLLWRRDAEVTEAEYALGALTARNSFVAAQLHPGTEEHTNELYRSKHWVVHNAQRAFIYEPRPQDIWFAESDLVRAADIQLKLNQDTEGD